MASGHALSMRDGLSFGRGRLFLFLESEKLIRYCRQYIYSTV